MHKARQVTDGTGRIKVITSGLITQKANVKKIKFFDRTEVMKWTKVLLSDFVANEDGKCKHKSKKYDLIARHVLDDLGEDKLVEYGLAGRYKVLHTETHEYRSDAYTIHKRILTNK